MRKVYPEILLTVILVFVALVLFLAAQAHGQVGGGGVVNPTDISVWAEYPADTNINAGGFDITNAGDVEADTFTATGPGTSTFSGDIHVPTPLNNDEAANKAYVDAQVAGAAVGATNQIYGELYLAAGAYYPTTISDTTTWHTLTNWTLGDQRGVTLTQTGITIAADGEYAGVCSFSMKRTTGSQDQEIEMAIFVNGVQAAPFTGDRTFTSDAVGMGALSGIGAFSLGDSISLRFRGVNTTSPNAAVGFQHANMSTWRLVSSTGGTNWSQYAAAGNVDLNGNTLTYGQSNVTMDAYTLNGTNYEVRIWPGDTNIYLIPMNPPE